MICKWCKKNWPEEDIIHGVCGDCMLEQQEIRAERDRLSDEQDAKFEAAEQRAIEDGSIEYE